MSLMWAAWHAMRGHVVTVGLSPAIPAAPVLRCKPCGLVRQIA